MTLRQDAKSLTPRLMARLVRAALDFCAADVEVQAARTQRRDLSLHHGSDGICCGIQAPIDVEEIHDPVPNVPESLWCKHCKRFVKTAINYQEALFNRRSAKTRMKNAYVELGKVEKQLLTGRAFMVKYREAFRELAK